MHLFSSLNDDAFLDKKSDKWSLTIPNHNVIKKNKEVKNFQFHQILNYFTIWFYPEFYHSYLSKVKYPFLSSILKF